MDAGGGKRPDNPAPDRGKRPSLPELVLLFPGVGQNPGTGRKGWLLGKVEEKGKNKARAEGGSVRGTIIGLERDGLDYVLLVRGEDSVKDGLAMPKEAVYTIMARKGNFIGKEIEYSEEGLSFLEDLRAS